MNGKINEMIQLIFYDLTFNENFQKYIERMNLKPLGKDYNTIAIIGCQSSGKSTLLNHLFNTNFEVMNESKGRGQTTLGIWVAVNQEFKVMIFDCEGTDSKERGEDRFKFEHCSSLFSLALADVLVINMWANDVGRYTASNYGVLKIVFEMNLKLFQQECAKKIFIVLRDFDETNDVREKISELILDDIYAIWREIKKPEKYKDCPPDKFFEFEFTTLPHKFYFEEKFNEEVDFLRRRLEKTDTKYLFKHVLSEKTVPMDGISHYCWQMWSDIINNKDLNIPSQKEMLARFRCNEIKESALQAVEPRICKLENETANRLLDAFRDKCEDIQSFALNLYDDIAKDYLPHVFQDIRRQLIFTLSQRLYNCFANQVKKMIPYYQKTFRQELEIEAKKNDNFFECAIAIKKKHLRDLLEKLEKISVFPSWQINQAENEELFDEIIENQRKLALGDKKNEIIKKIRNLIEDTLFQKLENITRDFWVELNQDYLTHFHSIVFTFKDYLNDFYKMRDDEFIPFVEEIEEEIHSVLKKDFYKRIKEISSFAVENFKKMFWYDEGIPRVWNKLSESQIDVLYYRYRDQNYFVFDLFGQFKAIKNPLKFFQYSKPSEADFTMVSNRIKAILDDKENKFEALVTEQDSISLKRRYEESIQNIYEDAKRRQANIQKQVIPLWAWLLIIYLGYEDVLHLVSSYWIIPVVILFALYGTMHMMGMGQMPITIFNLIKSQLMQKVLQ